jgi:hypothetical protein
VAIDVYTIYRQQDVEGEWYRQINGDPTRVGAFPNKFPGATATMHGLTASGKFLCGPHDGTLPGGCLPRGALEVWKKLPEAERKPGAVVVPQQTVRDKAVVAQLPPGTLILAVHQSALHPDGKGGLQRQANQYPEEYGTKLKYEPGHDYLWLTPAQWKAIVPESPHKGDRLPVPAAITEELAYHLRDTSRHGGSFPSVTWTGKDIHAQDLKLIVEEVATVVRLRLEGSIQLQEPVKELAKEAARFDGRLLGYLDYDTKKKAFVRMDVAALGDFQGWHWMGSARGGLKLTAPYKLGVSFELRDVSLAPPSNWHCRAK